jgi:hypothetical protein
MIMAVVAPAETTELDYQYPTLAWLLKFTPSGAQVIGTASQAAQLQFIIGIVFLALAYLLYRQA